MSLQFLVTLRHEIEHSVGNDATPLDDIAIVLSPEACTSFTLGRERSVDDDPLTFVTLASSFCSQRHAVLSLVESLSAPASPILFPTTPGKRYRSDESRHAELQVMLRDLNSTNGTLVNMVRVREAILHSDDVIVFGGGMNLAIGDVADAHNEKLTKWRVLIQQTAAASGAPLSPQQKGEMNDTVETVAGELAEWLSRRSRSSLERFRDSQRLPDGIVDSVLQIEADEAAAHKRLAADAEDPEKRSHDECTVDVLASTVSPILVSTTIASAMKHATQQLDETQASPLKQPPTLLQVIDMQPTPLRLAPHQGGARSPSVDPVPPYVGGFPASLHFTTVHVGKAVFAPQRIDPDVNNRLLSKLRRKRGPEAAWTLECNATHLTWSMLDPISVIAKRDKEGAPATFSLPLSSVEWVGICIPAPDTQLGQPKKKRGCNKAIVASTIVKNNRSDVDSDSTIIFVLKPKLQIPFLNSPNVVFPCTTSDPHSGSQWASFSVADADLLAQWRRTFEEACCRNTHLHSGVRILTVNELKEQFS
jgi:pSer/pThr/pTyr-binding forkhead associated (FHA) protein